LAGLLKPMWLSLIWTKEKLLCVAAAVACGVGPAAKRFEVGTPPAMVQRRPVPAQAMQERKLRRSIPSFVGCSDAVGSGG
jgi:hypothetical protein